MDKEEARKRAYEFGGNLVMALEIATEFEQKSPEKLKAAIQPEYRDTNRPEEIVDHIVEALQLAA